MVTPLQNRMHRPIAVACATLAIVVTCSSIQAQSHRGKKSFGWRRSSDAKVIEREADSPASQFSVFGSLKNILPFRANLAQTTEPVRQVPPEPTRQALPKIRYEQTFSTLRSSESSTSIVSAARPMRIQTGRSQPKQQSRGVQQQYSGTAAVGQAANARGTGTDASRVSNVVAVSQAQATATTADSSAQTTSADPGTFSQWLKKKVTAVKMPSFSLPFGRNASNVETDHLASASRQPATARSEIRRDSNVVPARMIAPVKKDAATTGLQNSHDGSSNVIRDPNLDVSPPVDRDVEDDKSSSVVPTSIQADELGVRRYFSPRHPDIAAPGIPSDRSARTAVANRSGLETEKDDGRVKIERNAEKQGGDPTSPTEPANLPTVPSDLRAKAGSKPWHEIPVEIKPRVLSSNAPRKLSLDHRVLRKLPVNMTARSIQLTQYQPQSGFPIIDPQGELGGRGAADPTSRPETLPQPTRNRPKRKRVDDEPLTPSKWIRDGFRPIGDVAIDIRPPGGETPPDAAIDRFSEAGEEFHASGVNRPWQTYLFAWEAPSVCHRPLYFEEANLERYGYNHGVLQPAYSAAHFFGRVTILPYLIGAEPPNECVYTLGHDRPGDWVPYRIHYPPPSLKGGIYQAATLTGLIFAIP